MQGKNQFVRFRTLQTEEVKHVIIMSFIPHGNADFSN